MPKDIEKLLGEKSLLSDDEKIGMIKENFNISNETEVLQLSFNNTQRLKLLELTGEFMQFSQELHASIMKRAGVAEDDESNRAEVIGRAAMMGAMAASAVPWAVAIRVITTAHGGDSADPEELDEIRNITAGAWSIAAIIAKDVYDSIFADDDEESDEESEE
jgi:hypothetical protein